MTFRDATPADIRHVLANMRAVNRIENFARAFDYDAERLAAETILQRDMMIALYALAPTGGPAAALVGAQLIGERQAKVGLVATDQWPAIARPAFRFFKRIFIPCALAPNVRRAEARVLDHPDYPRAWLARLGFTEEGPCYAYGRQGENFVHVAWLNPAFAPPDERSPEAARKG